MRGLGKWRCGKVPVDGRKFYQAAYSPYLLLKIEPNSSAITMSP
jgi:hypothetical protein